VGDPVMVLTYCQMDDAAAKKYKACVVKVDAHNRLLKTRGK